MEFFLAELIGTALLIILGDGVVADVILNKTKSHASGWVVITIGWGFAVAVAAFVASSLGSGAHLNPALTIAFAVADKLPWADVFPYVLGQFVGAMIGALVVILHYYPHFKETQDAGTVLGVFCTGPAIRNPVFNFVSEAIGTFVLVYALFMFPSMADGVGTLAVAALIVSIGMSLGGTTGYAINPARDLGPRLVHFLFPVPNKGSSDWGYAWIPVAAPIVGGLLAAALFLVI